MVCVLDRATAAAVRGQLPESKIVCAAEGLVEMATDPDVDLVLNGLVGAVGLEPTLAALAAGKTVAMANKEPIVMAGGLLLQQARIGGGTILPLDSEPNAIWQCLKGEDAKGLRRIILTASGGPFYGRTL
ncbi:MAG: 1-deoxy-D-xylulose-5-phosphate reductoisomerase, partial [Candidatus Latescibacterota bacterium]